MNSAPGDDRKRPGVAISQLASALELPFLLVGSVLAGGGIGYLLDRWFHTAPAILLIGGFLGFAAAFREVLRRLSRDRKRQG